MVNKFIVLICGLNIRSQNRITMEEQRLALSSIDGGIGFHLVGDKGSYLINTHHDAHNIHNLILGALRKFRDDLKIPGAAVLLPNLVADALADLERVFSLRYASDFNIQDYSISIETTTWRGGLALPLFPIELPGTKYSEHKTSRAMIFGWKPGGILVAKREDKNIHWGSVVSDPARRLIRRQEHVVVELTSRSGNILRELINY